MRSLPFKSRLATQRHITGKTTTYHPRTIHASTRWLPRWQTLYESAIFTMQKYTSLPAILKTRMSSTGGRQVIYVHGLQDGNKMASVHLWLIKIIEAKNIHLCFVDESLLSKASWSSVKMSRDVKHLYASMTFSHHEMSSDWEGWVYKTSTYTRVLCANHTISPPSSHESSHLGWRQATM